MKKTIKILLFSLLIYFGIALYILWKEKIKEALLPAIFFILGIFLLSYVYNFKKNGYRKKAIVVKKRKVNSWWDNMTTFYYSFKIDDKIYESSYSYNWWPKINDEIDVFFIKDTGKVIPVTHYYLFIFYAIFSILISIIGLILINNAIYKIKIS